MFNLSDATKEVDTNEKNNPVKNNKTINKNMNLSIFLAHDVLAFINFNNYINKKNNSKG